MLKVHTIDIVIYTIVIPEAVHDATLGVGVGDADETPELLSPISSAARPSRSFLRCIILARMVFFRSLAVWISFQGSDILVSLCCIRNNYV